MDGSPALEPSVELEAISGALVLTRVRVVDADEIVRGSIAADCLRGRAWGPRPVGKVVERTGVQGASVTLRDGADLYGCDNTPGPRVEDRRFCGASSGQLYDGHLRDPRLDIGCSAADGTPMGFAWVEPHTRTRYVTVEQSGYAEVYEVAGSLPVRIATTDVRIEGSSASFHVSEHDARGVMLQQYVLDAVVAG